MDDEKSDELSVDELRKILEYYSQHPPPWIDDLPSVAKKKKVDQDVKIVENILRLLTLAAKHFRNLWNWSEFCSIYLNHHELYVVWLACQCMSIVLQFTESEKHTFVNRYMDKKTNLEYMLIYQLKSRSINFKDYIKFYKEHQYITVENIPLSIVGSPKQCNDLVLVNSTKQNLRNLALTVQAGKAVCLVGPVGCGKSSFVKYLANITGHTNEKLLTVQLGEDTDSKSMLGSYHCTDIPGEFVWRPGALTKAVIEGKWLLLEDIDSASSDLAAVLESLIENQSLTVPGFRDQIIPATGFQLFFTQRVITTNSGYHHKHNIAIDLLGKHYIQVNVEPLNKNELIEVIETKFPILNTISTKIIDVFLLFSTGFHNNESILNLKFNERLSSTRDLIKWCSRIIKKFDVTSNESSLKVIQDAIDIFCCNTKDKKMRLDLACHVASLIGVVKTKAEFFLNEYKPTIVLENEYCIIGRITLQHNGSFLSQYSVNSRFALTRNSCCLLEKIACCIVEKESVLLVGETGVGKTSIVQLLAKYTGNKLIVLNMNQQSDTVDFIGGYKPVELKIIVKPIQEEFETLFRAEFNVEQNKKFLNHISMCFNNREWWNLIKLMKYVTQKAIKKCTKNNKHWLEMNEKIGRFEIQLKHFQTSMAFMYVDGSLIRALREGHWVLLDEINLASAETLQCLSSLLEPNGTITIYEKTDIYSITRHPNFRLMAAMNPATDIGKKDLPPGIRNRFTEFFVDEISDRSDLIILTSCYLPDYDIKKLNALSKFYLIAKYESEQNLIDGTGRKPHYSLRTYCRALFIASLNPCQSAPRSLYESFCLSYLTQLDNSSHKRVKSLIAKTIFGEKLIQGVISQPIPRPLTTIDSYVEFEGYWIKKGVLDPTISNKYILTASVKKNLCDLVRAVSLSCFPILIQGDTCVGKTSLITYLANASGNVLVRINNHEHTDLQEYIGSYSAQSVTGQLVFKEGVLVEAMRNGNWIILDELNLAPTDVLEALNRVLDDNRELFIAETQTTVKAHPTFRLFATQNPPGFYGGRKILSRAFKNRFIEMHFDEIPANELETILFERCEIPLSYAKKIVSVMKNLQSTRNCSSVFSGKHGFITLRDLFRWGERYRLANAPDNYNWTRHLLHEGFLVLASKVRKPEEEQIIVEILEKHFKHSLSLDELFTLNDNTSPTTRHILETLQNKLVGFEHIYMSKNIRRMIVLACKAFEFNEPVLLVGETGCGKTTVCHLIASLSGQKLLTVNCHEHTECSDFLGGIRPVRNRNEHNDQRLFEWVDGPLVDALVHGHMFLADEISLAEDSVLERFNSLLEPERKLFLSEKIGNMDEESELVTHPKFRFISTMNPGGDYGKKELSPALRNRLTEIWCESCSDNYDLVQIIDLNFTLFRDYSSFLSQSMVHFVNWLISTEHINNYLKLNVSIRTYLIWVKFIESMMSQLPVDDANYNSLKAFITFFKEGAVMLFLDKKTKSNFSYDQAIDCALKNSLKKFYPNMTNESCITFHDLITICSLKHPPDWFGFDGYYISRGNLPIKSVPEFSFEAITTKKNVIRLLRCMQIDNKAILLEGSPGVGKTSLIQTVSKISGHELTRINLSEQTDVSDLFGSDLPTENGFEWKDGPFLKALKNGNWILLDELNLASQSVLEGLNAVLDHRGELFIPELGRTFIIESKKTRLFACQNPMIEGGSRKGLPKSFLNRFLQVHLNTLDCKDIVSIIYKIHKQKTKKIRSLNLEQVVKFISSFSNKYNVDINLRDILRWVDVTITLKCNILDHLSLIFTDRTQNLQMIGHEIFNQIKALLKSKKCQKNDFLRIFPSSTMFNKIIIPRKRAINMPIDQSNNKLLLRSHIHVLNSLAVCMKMNWMPILIGSGSGKTSVINTFAQLCGHELRVLTVNSTMDTTEILGGFEQVDFNRHIEEFARNIENAMYFEIGQQLLNGQNNYILLLSLWHEYKQMTDVSSNTVTMASEISLFKKRIFTLIEITNELKDFDLSNSLKALGDRVSSTGSLNSLGKFEWIDSILIKCLNDGCWLLIDNVNLCSPAVLDRLNGLLEPNGVLELGEKGIDSNGHITVIKPHNDFRLFFAMDLKYGNISRAMKNRGVEIYMKSLEEVNNHDINSMLELQGVKDKSIRRVLLEIHTFMKTQLTGTAIGINDLLRAAYLISLNIKPGKLFKQTIRDICIDSYIHWLNNNSKQNVILEIDRILENLEPLHDLWFPNLKTLDILQSSNLCYIKQQCSIFEQYKYLKEIKLEDLLLCYFGRSSCSDIVIRTHYLSGSINFDIEAINNFIKQPQNLKFESLNFLTKSLDHIDAKDLPFDFRYLPANYFNKGRLVHNSTSLAENKIHLMLDHALYLALDENIAPERLNKKKLMIEDGGIKHDYAVVSNAFNDFINFFMHKSTLIIDEYNCLLLKEIIIWTRTVEENIFGSTDYENEFVVVLIHCYFNVIINHFIPIMDSITLGKKYGNSEELKMLGTQVLLNYLTPKPYAKLMNSLISKLKLPNYQCCKLHGEIYIVTYRENMDFMFTIKSSNIQTLITDKFKNQRDSLLTFKYTDCKSVINDDENNEFKINRMNDIELNLIPLWELIIERNFLTLIKSSLCNKNTEKLIDKHLLMKLLLQFVPTVSPFYCNSLKANDSFTIILLMEALKHSMTSIAVENPRSYLEWSSNKIFNLEKNSADINEEMLYSFEQPLFTVFIMNMLLKKNEPYYTFLPRPIRLIKNNTHNLMCITNFIWNSSKLSSNNQFEDIETLVRLVEIFFSSFLPIEFSSLDELYLMKDNKKCRNSIANKLNHHKSMINAIYDTSEELSQIKKNLHLYKNKNYSTKLELDNIIKHIKFSSGRLWVLTGMCLFQVFSSISPIDPLQKLKIRVECSKVEKIMLESRLNAEKLFCQVDGISELFPFKNYYIQRLKVLNKNHKNIGYRPEPPAYNYILEEVNRFSKMFGLDSNTYNIINSKHSDYEALVNEMDNWLNSVSNFHDTLNIHYASYPDILSGILLSINQMRYGMRLLKNYYKWSVVKENNITSDEEQLLTLFGEFPRFCPDIIKMINIDNDILLNINDKFRWYKLCLEELNNTLYLSGQLYRTDQYINTIEYVFEKFVYNWKNLQDKEEMKIREKSSLYKNKSYETLPTETEIANGIAQQFPTTKYCDFHDIENSEILDDITQGNITEEQIYNLTDNDINDICRLHTELVRPAAFAHWLIVNPIQINENEAIIRLKNSFADRFCMFGKLLMSKFMYLDKSVDNKMIPWLLMATEIANNPVIIDNKGYYDFYRDSNIVFAKKTFEILKNIDDQIQKLLNEWPDHPTLQIITKLVNRIMDFDWSSPMCRFLIGLELLLKKLHEWEEVSHRGVTVRELLLDVSHCIHEYRNLELNTWKNCLRTSLKKKENSSSKWWFHLFSIFQTYLKKQENFQQLVSGLQTFMETSTLGDYVARLELLYTFHCDVVCKRKTKIQTELCNASWNLYKYYFQFKDCINTRIETLSTDIKNKLHDFIKIVKWNDINYWSVKETVSKVQKTLHMFTRQYEEVLNNPASFAMITQATVINTKSDPYILPLLTSNNYLEKFEIFLDTDFSLNTVKILRNINKYSKKFFFICNQIMNNCSYVTHINELNDLINSVVESAQELQNLKIDLKLPKIKQKSQAKHILQQKRKALSELFKTLQNIGLSYKAGLINYEQMDYSIQFAYLPPLDINSALEFLIPKVIDNDLRHAWSDCESYFFKSISQNSALKIASGSPKLGQQEMNRVKGFINEIRNMTWNTKKILASNISSLTMFRSMMYLSNIIINSNGVMFAPSEDYQHSINYVINCINILHQFKVAIQCCNKNIDSTSNDSITHILNLSSCGRNNANKNFDEIISDLNDMINIAQTTLNSIIDKKTYNAMKLCNLNFMIREKYDALLIVCDKLTEYINDFYKNTWINNNSTINEHNFEHRPFVSNNNEPPLDEMNNLINRVLISVEKLYKKHTDLKVENEDDILLKYLIIKPLSLDLEDFDIISINKQYKNVLKLSVGNDILKSCLPLFEQYAMLAQYFITQQTMVYRVLSKMNYVLSVLFTDLASNGFCIPDEFLEGEDCTQSDGKNGMGLIDGDGTKDVSDQIQSQDQLDDAKKDYDDPIEQDNDLKEEENGIEMSDNFDGKLHNQDKDENENTSDNDGEDDLDKEMGKTEDGAGILDEKLWGSDSEDDNGDNEENLEENAEGGESTSDKELGAKTDNGITAKQDDQKTEIDKNNFKKDINEINDENEEDVGQEHINPYHADLKLPPEPEPMDLPNELQLDECEINEQDDNDNPFDIDSMKENLEENDVNDVNEKLNENINNLMETSDEENDNTNKIDDTMIEDTSIDDVNQKIDDGGIKDDQKSGEQCIEDESIPDKKDAKPSADEQNQIAQSSYLENNVTNDNVCKNANGEDKNDNLQNNNNAMGLEQQGIGQSQKECHDKQGNSVDNDKGSQSEEPGIENKKRKNKPGEMDVDRTLAEKNSLMKKRLKTTDIPNENCSKHDDDMNESEIDQQKGNLFKHVTESNTGDTETLDAATDEQLEKQPLANNEIENGEKLIEEDLISIEVDGTDDEELSKSGLELLPEKTKSNDQNNRNQPSSVNELENVEEDKYCIDGDFVLTHTVERGMDTMFHTVNLKDDIDIYSTETIDHKKNIKSQLDKWFSENENSELNNDEAWHLFMNATSSLSQELSEQLRLILEPSKASKLQGDFRTGRRINMRRVIPYIASQFKKDKIWLKRTKPSKRQFQIIIAIDNSSSMLNSHAKVIAFESLALVSKALTLIEAGELGIMSYGETPKIIHPLGEPFTDQSGSRLINNFTFDEQKTKVGKLIELATAIFEDRGQLETDKPAQLLIIVSDGRGIISEGAEFVKRTIRTASANRIFIAFIIVDNPVSQESILDIKMPIFEDNLVRIESYMDNFPFPFYIILRDIDKLPCVLSDALRDWFNLVTN